jgi:hypothetical protein
MDSDTLADFRRQLYACFVRAGDALMNAADALLTQTAAQSFVELSLSPCFERRWPSLYEAFEDATIDRDALLGLFAGFAPPAQAGQRLVVGVDASSIARPLARTARDRTYVHASNLPETSKPVVAGWQFSTLAVLPETCSSWTYVLDNRRIPSEQTQAQVAAAQLEALVPLLPLDTLLTGDGYYGSLTFLTLTQAVSCDKLLRLAKNRVLYGPAPPKTNKRGRPRLDGEAFHCKDATTQGPPDAFWDGEDTNGHRVEVACWHNLHFKQARHIRVSVLRVVRDGAADTKRDPKVSWFLFVGERMPPLEQIPLLYARRYSMEHGYRVDKQDLLWERARLRSPQQFQNWTDIVACVRNQLYLARDLAARRQAWERKEGRATPSQVRRAMGAIIRQLGTPARSCQVRGKSSGRRKGAIVEKAPRFKVIFKATTKAWKLV